METKMSDEQLFTSADAAEIFGEAPVAAQTEPILFLDPSLIRIDPEIKSIREWTSKSVQELSIAELAFSIVRDGQDVPAIVREDQNGYVLVDGQRRWEAVGLIRQSTDPAEQAWVLECIVRKMTEEQAFHTALRTNLVREQLTGIELAHVIKRLRQRYKWGGLDGANQIAELLCMNVTTVTQTEKLLKLPGDVQDKVRTGQWSKTTALELAAGKEEKQAEVAKRAQELAAKEVEERAAHAEKNGKVKTGKKLVLPPLPQVIAETCHECYGKDPECQHMALRAWLDQSIKVRKEVVSDVTTDGSTDDTQPDGVGEESAPTTPPAPSVQTKHVRQAQSEIDGARDRLPAPKSPEIGGLFNELIETGAYTGPMELFCQEMVKWVHGKESGRKSAVVAAWDDMADEMARATVKPKEARRVKK